MKILQSTLLIFLIVAASACKKSDTPVITSSAAKVNISFLSTVNDSKLSTDTMIYSNSLGQRFMINDLQYFISGIEFHQCNAGWQKVTTDQGIHYTDVKIPLTENWALNDNFNGSCYDSLRFIFGLNESDNYSNRFPDPPERDMFWPEILGGGYHYMKMNLKWKNDTMENLMPFMFHLGIGQTYAFPGSDSITGFIQNYFSVSLPCSFSHRNEKIIYLFINMKIDRWMDGVNAFDFMAYPMGLMQNEAGMLKAIQNGKNSFNAGRLIIL